MDSRLPSTGSQQNFLCHYTCLVSPHPPRILFHLTFLPFFLPLLATCLRPLCVTYLRLLLKLNAPVSGASRKVPTAFRPIKIARLIFIKKNKLPRLELRMRFFLQWLSRASWGLQRLQRPASKSLQKPASRALKCLLQKNIRISTQGPQGLQALRGQNPKPKIQSPTPKIQIQNPKSKCQNPKPKTQNPKSKCQKPKKQNPQP